ncbi:MAG: hypothetical protein M1834_006826 [Cirrosporium novae-zelandiae]|nr:MAG: hypothetical protein M1834_006826 [Cirrosporium novae-zelandiae]
MDPYSTDADLLPIQSLFLQGLHKRVIDFPITTLPQSAHLPARILQLRSRIALGEPDFVLSDTSSSDDQSIPSIMAARALATYAKGQHEKAVEAIEGLLDGAGAEDAGVCMIGGLVFAMAGRGEEAVQIIGRAKGESLEACVDLSTFSKTYLRQRGVDTDVGGYLPVIQLYKSVNLLTHLHLIHNHASPAQSILSNTRRTASDADALPLALASAYIALRQGSSDKYQEAFYVFEELASAPGNDAEDGGIKMAVCQAASEILLGRLDEARVGLDIVSERIKKQERTLEGGIEGLVNNVVLNILEGKDVEDLVEEVKALAPEHPFVTDIEEKSALFDQAAAKYHPSKAAA